MDKGQLFADSHSQPCWHALKYPHADSLSACTLIEGLEVIMSREPAPQSGDEIQVIVHEGEMLLLGKENLLATLDSNPEIELRPITQRLAGKAGTALNLAGEIQANSGRWMKLTAESAADVKKHGAEIRKLRSGVMRIKDTNLAGNPGQIVKHLKFESAGLLTPAAPMVLASMMQEASLEAQLKDIQEYLEKLDAKLDRILQTHKNDIAGTIDGIAESILEAYTMFDAHGEMVEVSWDKIQGLSPDILKLQGTILRELSSIAEELKKEASKPKEAPEAFSKANHDLLFWLYQLARVMQLSDRFSILEINRVEAIDPQRVDTHRRAIEQARDEREDRIRASLEKVAQSAVEAGTFNNLEQLLHTGKHNAVAAELDQMFGSLDSFSEMADIELGEFQAHARVRKVDAARAVMQDTKKGVTQALESGASVAENIKDRTEQQVSNTRKEIQNRQKNRLLRKLEKLNASLEKSEEGSESSSE